MEYIEFGSGHTKINQDKVCKLTIGGINRPDLTKYSYTLNYGDEKWRTTFEKWNSKNKVDSKVLLITDSFGDIGIGFTNSYTKPFDDITGQLKGGWADRLKQLTDALVTYSDSSGYQVDRSKNTSEYTEGQGLTLMPDTKSLPGWDGTSNIMCPSSLKFKFQFGQAGLFDGYKEVVLPALSLFATFAPFKDGTDGYYRGTMPTSSYVIGRTATEMVNGLQGKSASDYTPSSSSSDAGGSAASLGQSLLDTVGEEVDSIMSAYENAAYTTFTNADLAYFHFGKLTIGPCVVGGADVKFDFSNVTDKGYPFAATVELKDIQTIYMATREKFGSMIS